MTLITLLYVLLGWLMGVAINYAADILPTRNSLRQGFTCATCGAPQASVQWSAVVALVTKQPTCPACGATRHTFTRAVVMELFTPLLFLFLLGRYGLTLQLGLYTLYTVILLLITVTDLEHRLIFNVVILPAIVLGAGAAFISPWLPWASAMAGGVGAFVVVYLAALASRGGLGEGDVTLSTFLGFILGVPQIILSLTFGVFLGGVVAFVLLIAGRVGMKTFIPYGPFLTITGWIMLIWGNEIWQYYFY